NDDEPSRRRPTVVALVSRVLKGGDGAHSRSLRLPPLKALTVPALAVLVVALLVTFFVVLGQLSPVHPGGQLRQDQVASLARAHQVRTAVFEDEDAVVAVTLADGTRGWAAYPKSDADTGTLIDRLDAAGAHVR